jgi:hypothetical protein
MPGAVWPGPCCPVRTRTRGSLHAGSRVDDGHTSVHLWDASNFAIFVTHVLDTA